MAKEGIEQSSLIKDKPVGSGSPGWSKPLCSRATFTFASVVSLIKM